MKEQPGGKLFVILDAGMTELIRPMLYNAFHRIEPVVARGGPEMICDMVGPLCETSDTLGRDRRLARPAVGDLFAVLDAGACGAVMASNTIGARCRQVMVNNGRPDLIRRRQTLEIWWRWRSDEAPPPVTWERAFRPAQAGSEDPPYISGLHQHRIRCIGMSLRPKGLLAVFGLDQSASRLRPDSAITSHLWLGMRGSSRFPTSTPIGSEISRGLHGEREYGPDVMQLLACGHEKKPEIERALDAGTTIVCDRYIASSVAYGEAHGLDPRWLTDIQRFLPAPDLSILLDIAPETAAQRKAAGRDKYERDLALLSRVRASYHRQAAASTGWLRLDGERSRDTVRADVLTAVSTRLAPR